MLTALKSLSDNSNISVISVLTCIVFFHSSEIFQGFDMTGDFWLKAGQIGHYLMRLDFSSSCLAGFFCWHPLTLVW